MSKRKSSKRSSKRSKSGKRRQAAASAQAPSGKAVHVRSRAAFERLLDEPQPVIVDFWAPSCAPCRAMAPTFEKVAEEYEGRVRFVKVNTQEVPELAGAFGIRSIPTLVVLLGEQVVNTRVGLTDAATLRRMADKALDKKDGVTLASRLKRLFSGGA
jgi:thioredoxin 1